MKTGMMEVAGTKYPLSFSARVIVECNKRYGSIDNIGSALESEVQYFLYYCRGYETGSGNGRR